MAWVVFDMSSCVCRGGVVCLCWWLGGIATIGAALRRVAGVSGVYGRKTPRGCSEGPASRAFRWRCGRRARAATCGVNVRSGGVRAATGHAQRPPAMPRPPGPVWASDRSGAPATPTTPSVPRTPSGSGCLWEHSRAPSVRPKSRQGQERARQWPGATRMGLRRSMRLTSPPRAAPERDGVRSSRASSSPSISHV